MKIVIATDSFKGTLRADEVCDIISDEITKYLSGVVVIKKPMADGGEGTAKALMTATGGEWIPREVMGPLEAMRVKAGFVWLPDKTAVVEMATASGIELLLPEQMNPIKTTTYGAGELIKSAVEYGARKILLAVGGSATVDGGVGAAIAMGWTFLNNNDEPAPLGGGGLERIAKIVQPSTDKAKRIPVEVLCDVDNPLCGTNGAARIYGPQKGATPKMVERLETGLAHLAQLVRDQLHRDIANLPGAGAAGGLAAGAIAFMNATVVSGIETVMLHSNLRKELESADWVITGEGCFDHQSLSGKVVAGVIKMARETDTRIVVLAGQVNLPPKEYSKLGIEVAISTKPDNMPIVEALKNSRELLRFAARHFVEKYLF